MRQIPRDSGTAAARAIFSPMSEFDSGARRPADPAPAAADARDEALDAAEPASFDAMQRELERGLDDALGGFELLDRDLELDAGPSEPGYAADLIGVDAAGRLVLVVLLDAGELDGAIERALDLVAFADARRGLLERHFGRTLRPSKGAGTGTVVVLVGASFPDELARRARTIGNDRIRLLHMRELRTARGSTTLFVPLEEGSAHGGEQGIEGLAAQWSRPRAELLTGLGERLERVDPEVVPERAGSGVEWRVRGAALCSVTPSPNGLEGRVSHGRRRTFDLSVAGEIEAFVDAAIARFLALPPPDAVREEPGLRDVALRPFARGGERESLRAHASLSGAEDADSEPLLTQEELDAFFEAEH